MIAFEVPKGPHSEWYAMGKVMLGGMDATQYSDPGDENDYPETLAEQVAWLQRQFAKALRPYVGKRNTPELRRKLSLATLERGALFDAALCKPWSCVVVLRVTQDPGADHDPGDEDNAQIIGLERHVLVSAISDALK